MAVGGGEAEVVAGRGPHVADLGAGLIEDPGPLAVRERGLGEHRELGRIVDFADHPFQIVGVLDEPDRVGRDRERADRFVVAGVTDVENREALTRPHSRFVMHFGDERAHRVDHVTTFGARGVDDLGCRAVRGKHERCTGRNVGGVVDEDHALFAEPLDHEPVVHDLVVAVDGRLERSHHPGECLDRHLDAGAKASRFGEQHLLDRAAVARSVGGRGNIVFERTGPVSWANARCTSSCRRARLPRAAGRDRHR